MCAASLNATRGAGLSRPARRHPALDPRTALLDERSPVQWIARVPAFAELLNYFDASGVPVTDWSAFWSSDPAYLLAQMAVHAAPHSVGDNAAQINAVHATARRLNAWLLQIVQLQLQHRAAGGTPIKPVLTSLITDRLAPAVAGLLANMAWRSAWNKLEAALPPPGQPWAPEWQLSSLEADTDSGPPVTVPLVPITLTGITAQFDDASATLSQQAGLALQHSLAKPNHPAHSALFLSFVQLFTTLQKDMNGFTARHLDYYYEDVLRLAPSCGTPDQGTLVFALASNCPSYLLPAGSTVTAGQDSSGQAILYATQQDVVLNQAGIGALRTVMLPRDADNNVSAVYAAPAAASQDGLGAPLLSPEQGWPTFGAVPTGGVESPLAAAPGFLVTAPSLSLQQGQRQVSLHLQFGGDAKTVQDAYFAAVQPPPSPPAPGAETDAPHRAPLPADAFLLYVSGAAGWLPVMDFRFVRLAPGTDWLLRFVLPASFPPVAANSSLEPAVGSAWPMLKLVLNPKALYFPYSWLAALRLSAVNVRTKAWGLAPAQMSNSTGPIAVGKPFTPFGNAPLPGMSWSLSHPELAASTLRWARVDLAWLNLPLVSSVPVLIGAPNGFKQYYQGYSPLAFDNDMFTADLSLYRSGKWQVLSPSSGSAFALFADDSGSVLGESSWFFRFGAAAQPAGQAAASAAPDGTLRAAFDGPPYGFGQAQYPTLFAAAAIQNIIAIEKSMQKKSLWERILESIGKLLGKGKSALKNAIGKVTGVFKWLGRKITQLFSKAAPAPAPAPPPPSAPSPPPPPAPPVGVVMLNPPYVPTLKSVQLSYKSIDSVPFDGAQFYHVHPFGLALPVQPSLYPIEAGDGNLYIGLAAAAAGQPVSMHFELRERAASFVRLLSGEDDPLGHVSWRYLAINNAWQDFPPGSVASATSDLGVSGIVSLQLPSDLGSGGSVMGSTGKTPLSWVAASINAHPDRSPATIAILPQAATVVRTTPPAAGQAESALPPATITAMQPHIAAIKSVAQPYATSGGEAAESAGAFHVRVSERLRHKQRASQMRDYEQLVLAGFPAVAQVKCVGPNNSRNYAGSAALTPGQLVLVLVPALQQAAQLAAPFARPVLLQVAETVRELASACVADITVRNVLYEPLQATVDIGFAAGVDVNQCSTRLNQLLVDFLSPSGGQLGLGTGGVAVGAIAALITQQSYVARLNGISVWQSTQDGSLAPLQLGVNDTARPRTPWSALVSAPNHTIDAGGTGTEAACS